MAKILTAIKAGRLNINTADFEGNNLTEKSVSKLASKLKFKSLSSLMLGRNSLREEGIKYLTEPLDKALKHAHKKNRMMDLHTLKLNKVGLTSGSVIKLATVLSNQRLPLQDLDISSNKMIGWSGINTFLSAFKNSELRRMNLANIGIAQKDTEAFLSAIEKFAENNTKLQYLNLSSNGLRDINNFVNKFLERGIKIDYERVSILERQINYMDSLVSNINNDVPEIVILKK